MSLKHFLRLFLLGLLALLGAVCEAKPLRLDQLPGGPLGPNLLYLREGDDHPLTLAQARDALARGQFAGDARAVPGFGIGARPVWVYVALENRLDVPLMLKLGVGMPWLDHIQVYQVQGEQVLASWASGDEAGVADGVNSVVPGQGFSFPLRVPPLVSEVFIRVASIDPIVLPVSLELPPEGLRNERNLHYAYGFLYGFLVALIAYNLMVFIGLRKMGYLLYSLYLTSFIALNLAYSGHGYSAWWSQNAYFERYVSAVTMLLFSITGLAFATHFLRLRKESPGTARAIIVSCAATVVVMVTCMVEDWQAAADWTAFVSSLAFIVSMVGLGVFAVRRGLRASWYFLGGVLCGMTGSLLTLTSIWGLLPANAVTLHGVEVGVLMEATLLALALARDIRGYQEARDEAQLLASVDGLTGLLNRRAFFERVTGLWNTAARRNRPLSVAMIDIDHFKGINDRFGHAAGDEVLKTVAGLLTSTCRTSDVIARWGGEEFLLLLPETTLEQAFLFGDRLRMAIERCDFEMPSGPLRVTVSVGMAELRGQPNLETLINEADQWLYRAKAAGRNQVMGPPLAPPLPMILDLPERADQPY